MLVALGLAMLTACSGSTGQSLRGREPNSKASRFSPRSTGNAEGAWNAYTSSPGRRTQVAGSLGCHSEARLDRVAQQMANRQARGLAPKDLSETLFLLRSAGVPHVWPRIWSVEGPSSAETQMGERLHSWLGTLPVTGELRCGMAMVSTQADLDGEPRSVLVGLAVDAVADLSAFPTRARVGQWLSIDALGLVEGSDARVVLLGPTGAPRSLRAQGRGRRYRATFSLGVPGLWRIQVTARQESGPRPILEAWVLVDQEPPLAAPDFEAPGERGPTTDPRLSSVSSRESLLKMINVARAQEGLLPLHTTRRLNAIAQRHAEAMQERGKTAHDVGEGGATERLERAGMTARVVGENVARAGQLNLAHRALWNSPSHRQTLLHPPFRQVGLGISHSKPPEGLQVPARAAEVWVAELFVDHGTVLK